MSLHNDRTTRNGMAHRTGEDAGGGQTAAPGADRGTVPSDAGAGGDSLRTVLTAAGANLTIALAKGAVAVLTGSAALWAETLHSIADTGNEVLLFVGLRRSSRAKDPRHPFGYGQERYFWAFLASQGIFLIGGMLSIAEGIRGLLQPEPLTSPWLGIGVLALAGGFEGYSWYTARRQLRSSARQRRRTLVEHLTRASDPSATTVYLEDSAALIGVALAVTAVVLHLLTGWAGWESLASFAIGLLLITVALLLARRSKALLIDEAAPDDVVRPIREAIERRRWVAHLCELNAIYVGPAQLLVAVVVAVRPQVADRPGRELAGHVAELRADLLSSPVVAQVAVTVSNC